MVFDAFALGDPRGGGCDAERDQEADSDLEQVVKDGRGRPGPSQASAASRMFLIQRTIMVVMST